MIKKTAAKKPTKKMSARKIVQHRAQLHEDKIAKILSKVSEICDYAIKNLCTEQAQFEELEWMLRKCIK